MYLIRKVKKTYILEFPDRHPFELLLVTSVAYFKALMFQKALRWKVEEDSPFLKELILRAKKNPSNTTFEPLVHMEAFYKEQQGIAPLEASRQEKRKILDERNAAEKDLLSVGFQRNSKFTDGTGVSTDTIDVLHLAGQAVSLGEMVDLKRKVDGVARNRYRKKKSQ